MFKDTSMSKFIAIWIISPDECLLSLKNSSLAGEILLCNKYAEEILENFCLYQEVDDDLIFYDLIFIQFCLFIHSLQTLFTQLLRNTNFSINPTI